MPIFTSEQIRIGFGILAVFLIGLCIRLLFVMPGFKSWIVGQPAAVAVHEVTVTVTGAVKSPGEYNLPVGSTVADLLHCAGGLLPNAGATAFDQTLVDKAVYEIPFNKASLQWRININACSAEALESLPMIGEVKAQRIIEYRNAHGLFTSVTQLTQVNGIGSATIDRIVPYIEIGAADE